MASDRWIFCKKIVENPVDFDIRLIFADWLEDRKEVKAAARQRYYADLMQRAEGFYNHCIGEAVIFVFFRVKVKNGYESYRILKDGTLQKLKLIRHGAGPMHRNRDWFKEFYNQKNIRLAHVHITDYKNEVLHPSPVQAETVAV